MKKLIVVIMILAALTAFCACGKESEPQPDQEMPYVTPSDFVVIADNSLEHWQTLYPDREFRCFRIICGDEEKCCWFTGGQTTFDQWLESEYNVEGWYEMDDCVYSRNGVWFIVHDQYEGVTITADTRFEADMAV